MCYLSPDKNIKDDFEVEEIRENLVIMGDFSSQHIDLLSACSGHVDLGPWTNVFTEPVRRDEIFILILSWCPGSGLWFLNVGAPVGSRDHTAIGFSISVSRKVTRRQEDSRESKWILCLCLDCRRYWTANCIWTAFFLRECIWGTESSRGDKGRSTGSRKCMPESAGRSQQ